jgi:hypothetical protein
MHRPREIEVQKYRLRLGNKRKSRVSSPRFCSSSKRPFSHQQKEGALNAKGFDHACCRGARARVGLGGQRSNSGRVQLELNGAKRQSGPAGRLRATFRSLPAGYAPGLQPLALLVRSLLSKQRSTRSTCSKAASERPCFLQAAGQLVVETRANKMLGSQAMMAGAHSQEPGAASFRARAQEKPMWSGKRLAAAGTPDAGRGREESVIPIAADAASAERTISGQFHYQAIAYRDAAIHSSGDVEIVRGDHGSEARGAH